ncbi:MAG: serine hydrolase domain-containing protein [Bacteroidota bacterium]
MNTTTKSKHYSYISAIIFPLLLFSISPFQLTAQPPKSKAQQIYALLKSYAAIKQFNGNVLVTQKGKIVFIKSYGDADFELGVANNRQTRFRIGSITKQFTAVLIMQLREKGLVHLDSTISTYLPWYAKETASRITVRNLLSHTSGLANYTARPDFFATLALLNIPPREFAANYCQYKDLSFEPGTKFFYCNTDYYLLGLIIEAVTGKSYANALRENILKNANMPNTGIDSIASLLANRAKGYNYTSEGYVNADPINMATSTYAAGAMYSTVDDLLNWQTALEGDGLLSAESRQIFFTPVIGNHAFGLYINKMKNGKTAIGHPGGINGFSSFLIRFKEDDINVVLLDNSTTHKRGSLDNTGSAIYSILTDQPFEMPKMPITVVLTETYLDKGLQQMLKQYLEIKNDSSYSLAKSNNFLNDFGYSLLSSGKVKESLVVLKLATEDDPKNANTLDSYAEALKTDRQFALSIDYYKKVLSLEPANKRVEEEIKKLQEMK